MKFRRTICALLALALVLAALPAMAAERGQLMRVANCKRTVLRADNTGKAKRLARLPAGALVVYGGLTQGGFRLVRWGTQWGYVRSDCLETAHRAVRVAMKVWLRTAPGEGGDRLRKLKKGTTMLAVSDAENGYYCVCYDGVHGYVPAKSLRVAAPKNGMKAVALEDCVVKLDDGGTRRVPALTALRCFGRNASGQEYVCVDGEYGFVDLTRFHLAYDKRRHRR